MTSTNFGEKNVFLGQNCRQYRAKRVFLWKPRFFFFFWGNFRLLEIRPQVFWSFCRSTHPPARILTRTAQNPHVLHFFFLGGGRGFENKMIKRENPPGLGLALAPDGRQPFKTDRQAGPHGAESTNLFPKWAAVPSANTACWLARLSVCLHGIWRHILAPVFCAADGHGILKPQCFTQGRCLSQIGKQIRTTQVKPQ